MIVDTRRRGGSRLKKNVRVGLGSTLVACAALLAAGCSGGPELSGEWDFAVTIEEETAIGEVSLTQGDEDQLNGSGELCYEDECIPASMTGSLSEEGETVVLDAAEGYIRLQGDVSEEAGRLEGDAIGSGAEESGTFSAVRTSGEAPEAGSEEQSEQVEAAIEDYYEAFSYDGFDKSQYLSNIENVVVQPSYWSSPVGENIQEGSEDWDQTNNSWSENYNLRDFVVSEESESGAVGTGRYTREYDYEGETGTDRMATPLRVVQWGNEWKVLYAGGSITDPWETLPGTWDVSLEGYEPEDGFGDAADASEIGLEPPEFELTFDNPYINDADPSSGYGFQGEAIYNSGARAELEAQVDTHGEDQGEISIDVGRAYEEGAPSSLSLDNIEFNDEGDQMEGEVYIPRGSFLTDTTADFTAEKQD